MIGVLAACSSGPAVAGASSGSSVPTSSVGVPGGASSSSPGGSSSSSTDRSSTERSSTERSSTEPTVTLAGAPGLVPDVVGRAADDAVSEVRAAGVGSVVLVDATGASRIVAADGAWTVAAQSSPARTTIDPAASFTMFVVQAGEAARPPSELGFRNVPDVLSTDVGTAFDLLVAASITDVEAVDFSGEGRPVPADATWTVLAQQPVGGSWVSPSTRVTIQALPIADAPTP